MRVLLINNLSAGPRSASIYDFLRALVADGDEVVMRVTDTTSPAESLVHDADTFDAVVVAGGDGTVSSVGYALRDSAIPILPFPSGTANLLALNLDSPSEPYALAKMLRDMTTADFDLAELDLCDRTVGFSLIAGAGFDAKIMETVTPLKPTLGFASYWIAGLAQANPTLAHFTITLDGKTIETDGIGVLLVNFGRVQLNLSITPGNDPQDGLLEVAILKPQYTIQLFPVLVTAMLDRAGSYPNRTDAVEIHRAREVTIASDPPLPTQSDGDITHHMTPITARILPKAARFIVDGTSAEAQRFLR